MFKKPYDGYDLNEIVLKLASMDPQSIALYIKKLKHMEMSICPHIQIYNFFF